MPAYADLDQMLDEIDAVAIAVPPDAQADLAVRAAGCGCHLLLDKPIALTLAAVDGLVAAVERADVRSIVFFTRRFVTEIAGWLDDMDGLGGVGGEGWYGGHIRTFTSIFEPGGPTTTRPGARNAARCGTSARMPCRCCFRLVLDALLSDLAF